MCLSDPFKSFAATPRKVACHVTTRANASPCSFEARAPRNRTEDRRIGLNMNYSIIFTEISFSPETSILLQIIQIIHMTFGIISESDREGRAVCQSWLPGGKHNVTPTDKNSVRRESPRRAPDPPPLFLRDGRRPLSSPKKHPK